MYLVEISRGKRRGANSGYLDVDSWGP